MRVCTSSIFMILTDCFLQHSIVCHLSWIHSELCKQLKFQLEYRANKTFTLVKISERQAQWWKRILRDFVSKPKETSRQQLIQTSKDTDARQVQPNNCWKIRACSITNDITMNVQSHAATHRHKNRARWKRNKKLERHWDKIWLLLAMWREKKTSRSRFLNVRRRCIHR